MKRTLEEWRQCGCARLEEFLTAGDTVSLSFIQSLYGFTGRADEDTTYIQDQHPADVLEGKGLWHTFKRDHALLPFTYCGECEADQIVNRAPEVAQRVFVVSPFHSESTDDTEFYELLAIYAARTLWEGGFIPVAPHLYFPRFLKDTGLEREYGIEIGHLLMHGCGAMNVYVVDGYISTGMRSDIEYAVNQLGIQPWYIELSRERAEQLIERAGI